MWSMEIEVPRPVQNVWMFTNWYASVNFFYSATFPPVSARGDSSRMGMCPFVGGCSQTTNIIAR